MSNKRDSAASLLHDDDALIAWFVALARSTPDVYVRAPADGAITSSTLLREGLGIDSIGRVCVFYAVVDALEIAAADERAVAGWQAVGDVLAFVRAALRPPV